jgi:hypothetical protein
LFQRIKRKKCILL